MTRPPVATNEHCRRGGENLEGKLMQISTELRTHKQHTYIKKKKNNERKKKKNLRFT